jgi:hypothetical protein
MPEETENQIKIRVEYPSQFEKGSFRTITLSKSEGITAIIGKPHGSSKTKIQSLRFDKGKGWTMEKAKSWAKNHGYSMKSEVDIMTNFEGAVWTTKYVNDLPDSCFAWIEPGGKKDSEGKTIPRSLRHLPYKDESGKVDLPHLRNALARLSQVKNMPESVRNRVRSMLTKKLETYSKDNKASEQKTKMLEGKVINDFNVNYHVPIGSIEIVAEKGKPKKAILKGSLMNDEMNKNYWRAKTEELPEIAESLKGRPLKVQHSHSDWEIVGTNVSGEVVGNFIGYVADVTEPAAVTKFETGTWNAQNMGISPSLDYKSIECSVCKKNIDIKQTPFGAIVDHEHIKGQKYKGEVAHYIPVGGRIRETSLTSEPAYAPNSGSIDEVSLSASLEKLIGGYKTSGKVNDMTDEKNFESVIAQKDIQIDKLTAEIENSEAKIEELKASEVDKVKKLTEVEAELKATKEELNKFVVAHREAKLGEVLENKEIIAEILKKNMTNEEFEAELKNIKAIQASVRVNMSGSAPADNTNNSDKESELKAGLELFGNSFKELAGLKEDK